MEALLAYEASKCPNCGVDHETASDPRMTWNVEEHVCYSCRALAVMKRTTQAKHKDEPKPGIPHDLDGRVLFVEPHYE